MAGRTSWWPKDAAFHRRELMIELGEEFGAESHTTIDVLCAWAQEQRAGGAVKGGFKSLKREAFVTVSHAESIVAKAAEIGVLDDLQIDPDGRRFTCRISGWGADQERGRAAVRQEDKRNRDLDTGEQTVTSRDESRPVTQSPLPNQTRPDKEEANASSTSLAVASEQDDRSEVIGLCELLASLIVANDPKATPNPEQKKWRTECRLLLDRDGRTVEEVEQVMRWALADSFWRSNVLSMPKLREKFGQLKVRMGTGRPAAGGTTVHDFLAIAEGNR